MSQRDGSEVVPSSQVLELFFHKPFESQVIHRILQHGNGRDAAQTVQGMAEHTPCVLQGIFGHGSRTDGISNVKS